MKVDREWGVAIHLTPEEANHLIEFFANSDANPAPGSSPHARENWKIWSGTVCEIVQGIRSVMKRECL